MIVFNEGDGIPTNDLPYVFKKFFRGSNSSGTTGSGLGLYLVESIVKKHHGQVFARNIESGGCEFIIKIPLAGTDIAS
jgi:signal transduction histidine kinase